MVTRGWNGYRNKSQHRKSTPGEENSPRRSSRDSNPATFQSRVRCSKPLSYPRPKKGSASLWLLYAYVWEREGAGGGAMSITGSEESNLATAPETAMKPPKLENWTFIPSPSLRKMTIGGNLAYRLNSGRTDRKRLVGLTLG